MSKRIWELEVSINWNPNGLMLTKPTITMYIRNAFKNIYYKY